MTGIKPTALAGCIRDFFLDYLPAVRGMSPHTQQSYRYSVILLLRHLSAQYKLHPTSLDLADITADRVISFLGHLEDDRNNAVVTRNVRLAALHTFFSYLATRLPEATQQAQTILAIPFKRGPATTSIDYLDFDEIKALLSTIDRSTAKGRRDYALVTLMFNTGARVQEIVDLRVCDLQLTRPYHVRLFGKGRKERICPLWSQTAAVLREFLAARELRSESRSRLFLNTRGEELTRFGVRYILSRYVEQAGMTCDALARKTISPHSIRHSTAMHMLGSGVDLYSISQWLGHASINTTSKYATMDLEMKRRVLAKSKPAGRPQRPRTKWRNDPHILEWLESL